MAQACKICNHADRQAIDAILVEGWPSLRVIGSQYGVSKDSLLRHFRAHVPDAAADDGQGVEEPDELSLAVTEKEPEARQASEDSAEEKEPEARQILQVVEQEKEPTPYAEARYRAFIERWRGRIAVGRDELTEWPFDGEELKVLIEAAVSRGDLWQLGKFY